MLIDEFKNTLNVWTKELKNYEFTSLQTKPSRVSWSLGQLYIHLIEETNYYIEQVKMCLTNNDDELGELTTDAKAMFLNNDFPDEKIEGALTHNLIPQPESKEQLVKGLVNLKDGVDAMQLLFEKTSHRGKTRHPGLGYFNAEDWLRFAEMHLRHHLRQKKRVDDFLKTNQ
jgi:hypothetical protein